MIDLTPLIFALAFILIALVSGNNVSSCSGSIIGGRIMNKRNGILLTMAGYILGFLIEGSFLKTTFAILLPVPSATMVLLVLSIMIAVFIIAQYAKLPLSLSVSLTSALFGVSLALNLITNWGFMAGIVLFWILAIVLSITIVPFIVGFIHKTIQKRNIWSSLKNIRLLLIMLSFFASFTLGANTIGLIYSTMPSNLLSLVVVITAIIAGSVIFSAGQLNKIGNEIISLRYVNAISAQTVSVGLVEIATLLGMPLSNTQTFAMSVYGAGAGYKTKLIKTKIIKQILYSWVALSLVCFIVAYGVSFLIL